MKKGLLGGIGLAVVIIAGLICVAKFQLVTLR